jgi:hypothetical protein
MPTPYTPRVGPRIVLSSKEKLTIYRLLDAHLKPVDDDHADYEAGWDDERVAKESGSRAEASHVTRIRRDGFGNFSRKTPAAKQPGQGPLRRQLNVLTQAHNLLCESLGAQQFKVGTSNLQPD